MGSPEALQNAMHRPVGEAPGRLIENTAERQRWLARAANDVADLILHTPPAEVHARVVALAQRHARALGVGPTSSMRRLTAPASASRR